MVHRESLLKVPYEPLEFCTVVKYLNLPDDDLELGNSQTYGTSSEPVPLAATSASWEESAPHIKQTSSARNQYLQVPSREHSRAQRPVQSLLSREPLVHEPAIPKRLPSINTGNTFSSMLLYSPSEKRRLSTTASSKQRYSESSFS